MSRIHKLARIIKESRSHEFTCIDGRDTVRIVSAESGTQVSFLTADEVVALRRAIAAPADLLHIEGMPTLTWQLADGQAVGSDETGRFGITINASPEELVPAVCSELARLYRAVTERAEQLRLDVAKRMQDLYNDTWRNTGPRLSHAQIADRLALSSLDFSIDDDNINFTFYYSDGDLFAGHWIEVWLDATGNISSCGLAG